MMSQNAGESIRCDVKLRKKQEAFAETLYCTRAKNKLMEDTKAKMSLG